MRRIAFAILFAGLASTMQPIDNISPKDPLFIPVRAYGLPMAGVWYALSPLGFEKESDESGS
jgi:hypothetical protein